MTLSRKLSELDQKEEEERYLNLTFAGWQENEVYGDYLAADERGDYEYTNEII